MKPDKNNTYCKHPFKQIAIKTFSGKEVSAFWPCCMMGNDTPMSKGSMLLGVKDPHLLTPQQMYDHPRLDLLRHHLSNGVRDQACKTCWDQEDRGLNSFRLYSDEEYYSDDDGLSVIDITASNICNLRCRMCTPSASHQLMIDHHFFEKNNMINKLYEITDNRWKISKAVETTKSIQWNWIMNNTDKIKILKASGGEPFYDNKVVQLLQKYIQDDTAKDTVLMFHTNATQFDDNNINLLNKFKKNKHTFSIDGVGKIYEYIRFPSKFDKLEASVKRYIANVKNYDTVLNFVTVVTAHNILNLDEYITWTRSLHPDICCQFAEVYSKNRGIALKHLSKDILEIARERVSKYEFRHSGYKDYDVSNLLVQIDGAIKNNKENKQKVKDECELFDIPRNQNFRDYLDPILVKWLDDE